jgi:hypothetical protein
MRGRPARISNPVDIHVRVPGDLLSAAKRPGCSDADAIRKGLQLLISHEQPDSLEAVGIRIRELKKKIAKDSMELKELREYLVKNGVEDIDEFESSFLGED